MGLVKNPGNHHQQQQQQQQTLTIFNVPSDTFRQYSGKKVIL